MTVACPAGWPLRSTRPDRRQSLAGEIDLALSGGGEIEILRIDEAVSLDLQPDHAPRQPRDDQPPVRLRHRRAERADAVLLRRYQGLDARAGDRLAAGDEPRAQRRPPGQTGRDL